MNGAEAQSGTSGFQMQRRRGPIPLAGPRSPRFFHASDWMSAGVTAAVVLAVYLRTISPEVTLEQSGILAAGATYGSAPSPPGYPLWVLYVWVFTRVLPFSNIAWRIAVSSAVAGALACGV